VSSNPSVRSSYFDFRDLVPGMYELVVSCDVSDRTHVHAPVRVPVELGVGRVFLPVRLSVVPRGDVLQSGPSDNSPALGAAVLILCVSVFVFRAQLLARLEFGKSEAGGGASVSKSSAKDDKKSFLEGTIAGKKK
jgi:hypothetical protein